MNDKMDPAVKGRWIEALTSGDFKQGRGTLRYTDERTGQVKHCCLGVLSELAKDDGVISEVEEAPGLAEVVQEWAGIYSAEGFFCSPGHSSSDFGCYLSTLNDDGMSFAYIAEVIERKF